MAMISAVRLYCNEQRSHRYETSRARLLSPTPFRSASNAILLMFKSVVAPVAIPARAVSPESVILINPRGVPIVTSVLLPSASHGRVFGFRPEIVE